MRAYSGEMTDESPTTSSDSFSQVKALLELERITAPDHDLASLAKQLPALRRKVDRFYEVDTNDEVTASVFRADPSY